MALNGNFDKFSRLYGGRLVQAAHARSRKRLSEEHIIDDEQVEHTIHFMGADKEQYVIHSVHGNEC